MRKLTKRFCKLTGFRFHGGRLRRLTANASSFGRATGGKPRRILFLCSGLHLGKARRPSIVPTLRFGKKFPNAEGVFRKGISGGDQPVGESVCVLLPGDGSLSAARSFRSLLKTLRGVIP